MKYSLYEMTFLFLQRFYDKDPGTLVKQRVLNDFKHLLNLGWTDEDIFKTLQNFQRNQIGIPVIRDMMRGRPIKQNLINPNSFYYHNELRVLPAPPKRILDLDSGEIIKRNPEGDFFMEMRTSYTIDNLINYFVRVFKLEHTNANQLQGAFRYILRDASIEEVLFMIDVASDTIRSSDRDRAQMTPFRLTDYRSAAILKIAEKQTSCRLSGSDKIVPRRRVLAFRGGDSIQEGKV